MTARFLWFSYHAPLHYGRLTAPHQVRDGAAFAEIAGLLSTLGMQYGGLVLNVPPDEEGRPIVQGNPPLEAQDLLVLTTRPPLDDEIERDKKRIMRSRSMLEDRVVDGLRPLFFTSCARSRVVLSAEVLERFDGADLRPALLHFRQNNWAWCYEITHYKGPKESWRNAAPRPRTFAFLVSTAAQHSTARVLAAFGMGGTETLLWTRWLRTKGANIVEDALRAENGAMAVAQLTPPECLPPQPSAEALDGDWEVRIVSRASC